MTKSIILILISIFTSILAGAKETSISDSFAFVKESNNARVGLAIAGVYNPKSRIPHWGLELKRMGIQRERLSFENMKYSGNSIYLPGFQEPIIFLGDRKTLQFKGVAFELKPDQSAEENIRQMKKAWGGFTEFAGKSPSAWSLLLPTAHAGLISYCSEHPWECTFTVAGLALMVVPIAGEIAEPIIFARIANATFASTRVESAAANVVKLSEMTDAEIDELIVRIEKINDAAKVARGSVLAQPKVIIGAVTAGSALGTTEIGKFNDWESAFNFSKLTCGPDGDPNLNNNLNGADDRLQDFPDATRPQVRAALKQKCNEGQQKVDEFNAKNGLVKALMMDAYIANPKPEVAAKEEPPAPVPPPTTKKKAKKSLPQPKAETPETENGTQ